MSQSFGAGRDSHEIARDLQVIVTGESPPTPSTPTHAPTPSMPPPAAPTELKCDMPLARSENERARLLVDLDRKFRVDPAKMATPAASDIRKRTLL